ncbi:unnamed protein product [Lepeophtheirus salmonis]|uniref:(salmon louse) hypothetical protein n=1 Tax=Lepeophtheirus salmonis TaxID=72036 RepID=A0A7R8CRJ0_LEPSM|nr:unnamed protein product [Lepeophtheirus salmonis]CAF2906193.1 unnamed protein product [Lepeophtheirus salmonis]
MSLEISKVGKRDHRYSKEKQKNQKSYWKCTLYRQGSRARFFLVGDIPINDHIHSHGEQQAELEVHRWKKPLKEKSISTHMTTKILQATAVAGLNLGNKFKPKLIPPHWEEWLVEDSNYSNTFRRSLLFGTPSNLRHVLQETSNLIIDGTFKVVPSLFKQLVTVHRQLPQGRSIPAVYGLLPGKTQALYKNLFEELNSKGPFYSEIILSDYEKKASKCHPLMQDLVPEYRVVNSEIRTAFQIIGALPFVPFGQVDRAWRLLKPTLPLDMEAFSRYFEVTWIGTSSNDPLLSHNIVEGWYHGFQSLVNCAEPTIWKLMDAIKLEQALADNEIAQHLRRQPLPPRRGNVSNLMIN